MGLLVPVVEWREWWMDAQDAKAPEGGGSWLWVL